MGALRHDVNMGRFSSAGGRLLVAQPTMVDPNFHRTVVFVIDHGEDGAFGVVLNRPTATPVVAVLAEYAPIVAEPEVFFDGDRWDPTTWWASDRIRCRSAGWSTWVPWWT